jgi:hypothetical protein
MFMGLWGSAKANKENILYTVVTIFLLERVRRGWNRIEARGKALGRPRTEIERGQEAFAFRAALLYALPLVLPIVKYIFRSLHELSSYVGGLDRLGNVWVLAVVAVAVEAFLSIVIYNLLGIYVERMNSALGFFRALGRSVVDGSRVTVESGVRAGGNIGRSAAAGTRALARATYRRGRGLAGTAAHGSWRALQIARGVGARAVRAATSQPQTNK